MWLKVKFKPSKRTAESEAAYLYGLPYCGRSLRGDIEAPADSCGAKINGNKERRGLPMMKYGVRPYGLSGKEIRMSFTWKQ